MPIDLYEQIDYLENLSLIIEQKLTTKNSLLGIKIAVIEFYEHDLEELKAIIESLETLKRSKI